jgi:hypothetical protein
MTYPFIPIGIFIVFVFYALYLLIIKKDKMKFKAMLLPGVFFIVLWSAIYYFLLK